jgi:hypothetical protein
MGVEMTVRMNSRNSSLSGSMLTNVLITSSQYITSVASYYEESFCQNS